MRVLIKNAYIYDSYGESFRKGDLLLGDDKIIAVGKTYGKADLTLDAQGAFLLPGFIDIHTHGRDGYDFTSADEQGLRKMAKGYLAAGTTTVMATLASAPSVEILKEIGRRLREEEK